METNYPMPWQKSALTSMTSTRVTANAAESDENFQLQKTKLYIGLHTP